MGIDTIPTDPAAIAAEINALLSETPLTTERGRLFHLLNAAAIASGASALASVGFGLPELTYTRLGINTDTLQPGQFQADDAQPHRIVNMRIGFAANSLESLIYTNLLTAGSVFALEVGSVTQLYTVTSSTVSGNAVTLVLSTLANNGTGTMEIGTAYESAYRPSASGGGSGSSRPNGFIGDFELEATNAPPFPREITDGVMEANAATPIVGTNLFFGADGQDGDPAYLTLATTQQRDCVLMIYPAATESPDYGDIVHLECNSNWFQTANGSASVTVTQVRNSGSLTVNTVYRVLCFII